VRLTTCAEAARREIEAMRVRARLAATLVSDTAAECQVEIKFCQK